MPWFVEWISPTGRPLPIGKGTPDFRIMSHTRFELALREQRCWVCGRVMHSSSVAFVIGPMCAVNRTSAEPPSHKLCAEWSARNCPFLTRPHMRRREAGMPEQREVAGMMIARNPGVTLVWSTRRPSYYKAPGGGILFDIGPPSEVSWWREGRPATRQEIQASIDSGLPELMKYAQAEGEEAVAELGRCVDRALELLPAA